MLVTQFENTYGKIIQKFGTNEIISSQKLVQFCPNKFTLFAFKNTELIRINKLKINRFLPELYLEKLAKVKNLFLNSLNLSEGSFGSIISGLCVESSVY